MRGLSAGFTLLVASAFATALWSPAAAGGGGDRPHAPEAARTGRAIEFSPLSPVIDIYVVQLARRFAGSNEAILGASYANIEYDRGRSHAPGLILGYRRYLWKKLHAEYQLWPSYNWYYEREQRRYYPGPELWNEFRAGYTFDFSIEGVPAFLNLQYLLGFALYGGNKPQSFEDDIADEKIFSTPMFFVGWRF